MPERRDHATLNPMPGTDTRDITVFRAAWAAPMDRPPMPDGALCVAGGRIVRLLTASEARREFPAAEVVELGDVVLLPGLVNPHVHLELSDLSPGGRPRSLADWIISLIKRTPERDAETITAAVQAGVAQSLRYGVTTLGDITAFPRFTRTALTQGPLHAVSFGEVRAMATRRGLLEARVKEAENRLSASDHLSIGVSPHSPYSIEIHGYRRCVEAARSARLPIATDLAEAPDEAAFLSDHQGSLRAIWDFLGAWDDQVSTFAGGPIRFAKAVGLLDHNAASLLAHVNYCDDAELEILSRSKASVVYCPRTHAFFGHPPHRWREMLSRGINVAVGTDSCASSPNLNLVDDLRLLRQIAPQVPAQTLWELATTRAATSLGLAGECGALVAGSRADFITFPKSNGTRVVDWLDEILDTQVEPASVWISGEPMV